MNVYEAEKLVKLLFLYTDEREWDKLKDVFAETFILDYESMNGKPPKKMTPNELVESWRGLLPGFEFTHHQLGNIITEIKKNKAHVLCYGTATHYIQDYEEPVWNVVGTYDLEIIEENGTLKVDKMRFNYKYATGNLSLPDIAKERLNQN